MPERLLDEERVKDHINAFYDIKDKAIRAEYAAFNNHCQSVDMLLMLNCLCTFLVFPYLLIQSLSFYEIRLLIIAWITGWSLYIISYFHRLEAPSSHYSESVRIVVAFLEDHRSILQTMYLLALSCLTSFYSIRESWKISTISDSTAPCWLLYIESTCLAMLLPILAISITREYRFTILLPTVGISVASGIACSISLRSLSFTPMMIGYFLFVSLLTADRMRQQALLFFMNRKLQDTIAEKERMEVVNRAEEMRHMVANVAHDLKTPLSSFMSGIEIILSDVQELEAIIHDSFLDNSPEYVGTDAPCDQSKLDPIISSLNLTVRNIQNTNRFMLMTINRCLDYTKAQSGLKLIPKYETIDLRECLHLPMDCMRNIQQKIEIEVEHFDEEICSHIITDGQWLQENLLCLLSNAVKYSDGGKVDISVRLIKDHPIDFRHVGIEWNLPQKEAATDRTFPCSSPKPDRRVLIEIQDNGIGLSEEAMSSLYHPFKQSQRLAGGTGLGLYSLAGRLEALQGKYGVKQRRDGKHGSLFWFAFPYRPDAVTAATMTVSLNNQEILSMGNDEALSLIIPEAHFKEPSMAPRTPFAETTSTATTARTMERFRVLICDDSPSLSKMISRLLEKQGHSVSIAENGFIALNFAKGPQNCTVNSNSDSSRGDNDEKDAFDVILMDLQMPVMDGLEATRRIREFEAEVNHVKSTDEDSVNDEAEDLSKAKRANKHSKSLHQLIIGMSANSDHETMQEAFEAGVDSFIAKPFSADVFMKMVMKCRSATSLP